MRLMKWQMVLIFSLCSIIGHAQKEELTVLYTNNNSGISYKSKATGKIRVFAGLNLPVEGKISIARGAWANVLIDGQKIKLEGPRVVDLLDLASSIKSRKSPPFLRRFWNFLSNSVSQTGNTKELEKYHRQYLTEARAGISGFGDAKNPIKSPMYLSQVLGNSEVDFQWAAVGEVLYYEFAISARDMDQVVLTANTKSNHLYLEMEDLVFESDQVYQWQVTARLRGDSTVQSEPVFFTYNPDLVASVIEDIQSDDDFKDFDEFDQPLYLLNKLEEEGFFQTAYSHYQELIQNAPNVQLYKKLFASFLVRMDAVEEAKTQIIE